MPKPFQRALREVRVLWIGSREVELGLASPQMEIKCVLCSGKGTGQHLAVLLIRENSLGRGSSSLFCPVCVPLPAKAGAAGDLRI